MSNFYLMKYKCRNCYMGAVVHIPRKQEAPLYFTCPTCGLNELWKTDKDIDWIYVYDIKGFELVLRKPQ